MDNKGFLVVDVQPAYDKWCGIISRQVARHINESPLPVTVMWVGAGITSDSELDVSDYLLCAGLDEAKLPELRFVEKDYGFFRGWMDNGVPAETTIEAGKQLLRKNLSSSESLDLVELFKGDTAYLELCECIPIFKPHWGYRSLEGFQHLQVCGGSASECLAEVELLLGAMGISAQRTAHLVYG